MSKSLVLLGSGGHAGVLMDMLCRLYLPLLGIVDPNRNANSDYHGAKILGGDDALSRYSPTDIELINGIGSIPYDKGVRYRLFTQFSKQGFRFKTLIDPAAFVASCVELGEGVQVMIGAMIQTGTKIANNSIVNTGAIIDHDCQLGKHVHIAPGAVLSGEVEIADNVHVGTGAHIIQGIKIGTASIIGAGAIVTKNVGDGQIVYPARSIHKTK